MSDTTEILPAEPGAIHSSCELVRTTMGEMLGTLPHGFLDADGHPTTYAFHRPTMGTQRRLGALKANKDLQRNPGKHVSYWLATALSEIGGEPTKGQNIDKLALRLSQLTVGDVLFLLFAWQHRATPKGMPLGANGCGVCGATFDQVMVDLATMEVWRLPRSGDVYPEGHELEGRPMDPATSSNPPRARVGLSDGMPCDDVELQTLIVGPPSWVDTFGSLGRGQIDNGVLLRCKTLQASVVRALGSRRPRLPMDVIDELMPDDAALIDEAMGEVAPSPLLEVEVACPSCGATNVTALNWQDPMFFTGSSGV